MLLVESSNQKDISVLEESFNREGNCFSVPLKKTDAIKDLVSSLRYEYFLTQMEEKNSKSQKKRNGADQQNYSYLLKKIIKMIQNFLKLKISLVNIREIFYLIKQHEERLEAYHSYILNLNEIFMMESQDECEEEDDPENSVQSINKKFENALNPMKNKMSTLYSDIKAIEEEQKMLEKINSLQIDHSVDGVRSLSSFSSRGTNKTTREKKKQLKLLKHDSLKIHGSMTSNKISYSYEKIEEEDALPENYEKMELTRISDLAAYDSKTNSTFYCPTWKKNLQQKKQVVGKILSSLYNDKSQVKSHDSNASDFAQDLSGEVRPTPSVLTNQNIHDLLKRDKRQDILKSHILKQSFIGVIKPSQIQEKDYERNMKKIKLNQKLKQQLSPKRQIKANIKTVPPIMKSQTQRVFQTIKTMPDDKVPIPKELKKSKQGLFLKFKKACFGN